MTSLPQFRLMTPGEVEEVSARAWQNVAAHSAEYTPLVSLASLMDSQDLPTEQLLYRARLQFLHSDQVRAFVPAAGRILLRLAQTTEARLEEGRVAVGYIDWPTSVVRRVRSSDPSMFVLRQSEVHRDVPENRLLKFLLGEVAHFGSALLAGQTASGWQLRVETLRAETERLLRHPLLRVVPSECSYRGHLSAKSSRVPGYRQVARAYELYDRLFRRGDPSVLLDLFRERVLVPEMEERAFELLVLFRLVGHLEELGARRSSMRLVGRGDGPTFVFAEGDRQLDVHFQNVPKALAGRSLYRRFMAASGLGAGTRRPDIVVRVWRLGALERTVIIEAKCSVVADTLRDGAFQLLGYLSDFQLCQDPGVSLVLVGYGQVPQHPDWPAAALLEPFAGYVTDLPGLRRTLAALALC